MPIIGAHVSVAGGLDKAFHNAASIGATAIQIFGASPRQWHVKLPTEDQVAEYKAAEKASGLGPVFLHAPYLANLATPKQELWDKSVKGLSGHLAIAEAIGARGLIFHIGSGTGSVRKEAIERVILGMKQVLAAVPGTAYLIMENAAGGGDKIGATPEEIGIILKGVKDTRVKVCLDTQHAFASGLMESYSDDEIETLSKRINASFGTKNLVALHLNDSKSLSGSQYDRHENIGEGHIGKKAFVGLSKHTTFKDLPWLLEVPGFADEGPDKKNVDILKHLVS